MKTSKSTMPRTNEILELAKLKATALPLNTSIRVKGAEYDNSYWVFNFAGRLYIGTTADDQLPVFFDDKQQYIMSSNNGVQNAILQRI